MNELDGNDFYNKKYCLVLKNFIEGGSGTAYCKTSTTTYTIAIIGPSQGTTSVIFTKVTGTGMQVDYCGYEKQGFTTQAATECNMLAS